jgi:integrative and conjugative element protein (TIGR02256 family)
LGEACGALSKYDDRYYRDTVIGGVNHGSVGGWRDVPLVPVDAKRRVTQELARQASGISDETAKFNGVLAGVGALGGALADLWSREAWGLWTIVDPDYVEPHNIIRHIVKDSQVGLKKVEAVKHMLEANSVDTTCPVEAIATSILNVSNSRLQEAIAAANLLVDATTTLHVPREISHSANNPRSASAFLTPSGFGSVLLVEDTERHTRLGYLEAQYYREIINNEWGANHLTGHLGHQWVGAGCRDVSAVISFEMVQLHAATLARRIRYARDQEEAGIYVWEADPLTGSLTAYKTAVFPTINSQCGLWSVVWDLAVREKLASYRAQCLPNETGGIILGYIDQKLGSIFVVDVLPSPPDSETSTSGFTRGISGLETKLDDVAKRTANIVGYIGDWHSHPPHSSARPSLLDAELVQTLAETLAMDGQPALMMIVGTDGVTVTVREA